MPQPVAMELQCRDGLNLPGVRASCQRFSVVREILRILAGGRQGRIRRQNLTQRAARTRGAGRTFNGRQGQGRYDVSATTAWVESFGGTHTKGDAPVRGKSSPRA